MECLGYSVINNRGAGTLCENEAEAIEIAKEEYMAFIWRYNNKYPVCGELLYVWTEGALYRVAGEVAIERPAEDQG